MPCVIVSDVQGVLQFVLRTYFTTHAAIHFIWTLNAPNQCVQHSPLP
jgi:hypothetical protein